MDWCDAQERIHLSQGSVLPPKYSFTNPTVYFKIVQLLYPLPGPLHFPIVGASSQRLNTHHLPPEHEALRLLWVILVLSTESRLATCIRQTDLTVSTVGIKFRLNAD